MTHSALIRGEDGGLDVRRFRDPADAQAACAAHEETHPQPLPTRASQSLRGRKANAWSTARLARELGCVSQRTIIRRCHNGDIPCVNHGTAQRATFKIPGDFIADILRYGLAGASARWRAMQS